MGLSQTRKEEKQPVEGVGKILPAVLKKHLCRPDESLLAVLAPLWPSIIGKGIARQCRPVAFAAGTLTIATSCPTWAAQFRQLADEIRTCINRFLGGNLVRKLKVRVDPSIDTASVIAVPENDAPIGVQSRGEVNAATPLEPDVARVLQQSCAKYFARGKRKVH
jgi:hypothetical protein